METLGLQGMPLNISDYPYDFTGWNFISSISSIISVAATALFLHVVYLQLVKGKAIFGFLWAVPQLFSDYLRILKDKCAPGLEWALSNPPKPHSFTSLPLQSLSPIRVKLLENIGIFNNNGTLLIDLLKDLKTKLYQDPSFDCEQLNPWIDRITNLNVARPSKRLLPSSLFPSETFLPSSLLKVYVENKTSENLDLIMKYIDWYIKDIKSLQTINTVAVSFLVKDEDVSMDVSTITILLNNTRTSEQNLLFFDMLSTLDEEKQKKIQKEIFTQSEENLTKLKGSEKMHLYALIVTLERQNFDGFGSDRTKSIWNELNRLSSTYPIK
jgi:hypothetical protein